MESFYGGRRGEIFNLVAYYETKEEMIRCFKRGGDYKDVNYGEYVLISTKSKSHPDNGKLYRRGMDYTNDLGGAEYKGQICGSQGETPALKIEQLDNIDPIIEAAEVNGHVVGETGGKQPWTTYPSHKINEEGEEEFYDNIEYAYYTIQDENYNVTGCYLGIKIPRYTQDLKVSTIDFNQDSYIENDDEQDNGVKHNFYDKWHFYLPRGVHGQDFTKVELTDKSKGHNLIVTKTSYSDTDPNIFGVATNEWVGDVQDIDDITFDPTNSKLKVIYKSFYRDSEGYLTDENGRRLVDEFTGHALPFDSQEGKRIETYIPTPIKFIENVSINEFTKKIVITYSTYAGEGHETEIVGEQLKVIDNVEIDKETKRVKVTYNTFVNDDGITPVVDYIGEPIRYIVDQYINEDTKKLHVVYNSPKEERNSETGEVLFNEDGTVKYLRDNKNNLILEEDIGEPIKFIDDIRINEDTKKLEVLYNTNSDYSPVSETPIKFIDNIILDKVTRKFTVKYNTNQEEILEEPIQNIIDVRVNEYSQVEVKFSLNEDGSPNTTNKWTFLGSVKGSGLQLYDAFEINSTDNEIDKLNERYPDGLEEAYRGWAVGVTKIKTIGDDIIRLTQYYVNKDGEWILVSSNSVSTKKVFIIQEDEPVGQLDDGGVWGIAKKRTVYNILS